MQFREPKMKFHISSCGRSGTKYVAKLFNNMGYTVLHEMGDDWTFPREYGIKYIAKHPKMFALYNGIIGWKWSLLTPKFAEMPKFQYHMVRTPLKAIESATTHADELFSSIEKKLGKSERTFPEPELERANRAINYWIKYNQKFQEGKKIIKVEEMSYDDDTFHKICDELKIPKAPRELAKFVTKDLNQRKDAKRRVEITPELLKSHFKTEFEEIKNLAKLYKYEI